MDNPVASTVNKIIQAAVFDLAIRATKIAILAEAPWLKLPVISNVFDYVMNRIGQHIYVCLAHSATFAVIDFQTEQEKQAYARAEGALRAAHLSGDPNALLAATKDFKTALAAVIHFDGSSPA